MCFVAVGEDGLLGDSAAGKGAEWVEKEGLTGKGCEDLVGDGSVHACAAAGSEEDEAVHVK